MKKVYFIITLLDNSLKYHYATYNKYSDREEEDSNEPRLSEKYLNKLLCSNIRMYYRTHELNDTLYLHFKGFKKIENLHTFTNLKVLYMEGNAIKKIEGLSNLKQLTSLYLHENVIEKIEGLDELENLVNLNLSDNCISKIENLANLKNLTNLLLKRNRIGINGIDDLSGLLELSPTIKYHLVNSFSVIDVSDNRIDDENILEKIFVNVPSLRVLYLMGNDCIRKISHYRKKFIAYLKDLRYLDDRPVFEDERRFSEAFARGGLEEEKLERVRFKKEKEEAEIQRLKDFEELVNSWKGNKKQTNNAEVKEKIKEEEKKIEENSESVFDKSEERRKSLMKMKEKQQKNEIFDDDIPVLEKVETKIDTNTYELKETQPETDIPTNPDELKEIAEDENKWNEID